MFIEGVFLLGNGRPGRMLKDEINLIFILSGCLPTLAALSTEEGRLQHTLTGSYIIVTVRGDTVMTALYG